MNHERPIYRDPKDPDACHPDCDACELDRYQNIFDDIEKLEAFLKELHIYAKHRKRKSEAIRDEYWKPIGQVLSGLDE